MGKPSPFDRALTRRAFVRGAGAALAGGWLSRDAVAQASPRLAFQHLHTGERLSVPVPVRGSYPSGELEKVDWLLRDHYSDATHPIDPRLLGLLHRIQQKTGSRAPYQVISGYRSPQTNERLRAQGRRVGRRSLHMEGKAIDVRLADLPSAALRETALGLARGGVGYYARNDFVHLDVGRVRAW